MPKRNADRPLNSGPQEAVPTDNEMAAYQLIKMRQQAVEFFDAGFLIFTKNEDGHTSMFHTKFGNEFALRGLIESYMDEHINPHFSPAGDSPEDDDEMAESN